MTLEEAIKHAEDVAMRGDSECNKQHKQLHEWLSELKYFRDALNSGELKWTVPSPLSVDEDFFIPVRSGKSDIPFDHAENAKDVEYMLTNLWAALTRHTVKDVMHVSGIKKTVHYVDVGDLEPEAALEYITQCREALKNSAPSGSHR